MKFNTVKKFAKHHGLEITRYDKPERYDTGKYTLENDTYKVFITYGFDDGSAMGSIVKGSKSVSANGTGLRVLLSALHVLIDANGKHKEED